jgi:hypothetical protein
LKDLSLDQNKIVNDLFTDNGDDLVDLTKSKPEPDVSLVIDHDYSSKNSQTKLKVIRKSTKTNKNKLPTGLLDDKPLHAIKKRKTVKIKRNRRQEIVDAVREPAGQPSVKHEKVAIAHVSRGAQAKPRAGAVRLSGIMLSTSRKQKGTRGRCRPSRPGHRA